MTAALQETLMGLGVPDDRVRVEAFAGMASAQITAIMRDASNG